MKLIINKFNLILIAFLLANSLSFAGDLPAASVTSSPKTDRKAENELKKQQKLQKLANSPLVKWLAKRALIKQDRKQMKRELAQAKGDKATQKNIRQSFREKKANMDSDLRLGIIVAVIGLIITILGIISIVFTIVGAIILVIGLVLILLALA